MRSLPPNMKILERQIPKTVCTGENRGTPLYIYIYTCMYVCVYIYIYILCMYLCIYAFIVSSSVYCIALKSKRSAKTLTSMKSTREAFMEVPMQLGVLC